MHYISYLIIIDKQTLPQISPTTVEAGRQETLTCTSTSSSTPSPTGQAMYYISYFTIVDKPTTPQISPTTVETGRQETLTCTSTSTSTPSPTGQALVYTWTINNIAISDPRISTSGNMLIINTVRREDKDNLFQCTARENQGLSSDTTGIRLNVYYPPEGSPLFVNPVFIHNESNTVSFTCSLTSNGNPPVSWIWIIGSRNFTSGYITYTGSQSTLRFQISKTENNKICRCRAVSSQVSYDKFSEISLDVRYPSVIISLSPSIQIIVENQSVSVTALVEGNPYPVIELTNDDNKTTLMTDNTNSNTSVLRFDRINCLDTATYKVTAFNGYGDMDSRSINISVLCPPRPLDASKFPQKIPVKNDKLLNVSFVSVGNPIPTVQWYLRKIQTSSYITMESTKFFTETKAIGKVLYETILKRNITVENFGEYFAELKNSKGFITITFEVVSQGRPDPPTDLIIDCSSPHTARLYWISQFNGMGEMETQQFNLLYKLKGSRNFSVKKNIITDIGWGKNLTVSVTLSPGVWIFRTATQNIIGTTESTTNISCNVKGSAQESSEEHSSDIGRMTGIFFAGFLSCAVISGIIHSILYLRKRGLKLAASKRRNDNAYDSIQGASREPNTYEDLSKPKHKDANVYINTSFGS